MVRNFLGLYYIQYEFFGLCRQDIPRLYYYLKGVYLTIDVRIPGRDDEGYKLITINIL